MINPEKHNILDGVTLKAILEELVNNFGLEELGERTNIRCFTINPTFNSSLKFLRKTPWARVKVENLYVELKKKK
jgi:uncharacterized protein (DUF2132 family)